MRYVLLLAVIVAIALSPTCADVNIGAYARSVAMGGAGLAVADDPLAAGAINPAAYAYKDARFRLLFPSVDFRMQGTSLSKLLDVQSDVKDSSGDSAVELARELGKQDTKAELAAYTGFAAGPLVITLDGQANVGLVPGAGFREWANTGEVPTANLAAYSSDPDILNAAAVGDYGPLNDALADDGYTAEVVGNVVAAMPAVSMGFRLPKNPNWNVGVRLKALRSQAAFERVVPQVESAAVSGTEISSVELDFDTDDSVSVDVDDTGLGMDLGIIYEVPNTKLPLSTALVISNFIEPSLEGVQIDRMISAGAALRVSNKVLVAGDFVNINGAYDQNMRLRLGGEIRPLGSLAFRAGYGNGGLTFGLGFAGFNIAYAKDTPAIVGRAWRF